MFDEPITTVAQAKEFFTSMGCTSFNMSREYPERYDEYVKLKIPRELETEWRQEEIDKYLTEITAASSPFKLWILHSSMAELVKMLKTRDALEKMLKATQLVRDRVPLEDRVIVSETINGRQVREVRGGLIYLAYDLNWPSVAKEFAELSLHFAVYVEGMTRDLQRCQRSTRTCREIMEELGL